MERNKKWHSWLIICVALLTVYNILPTIIFYSKPLSKPIGEKEALTIQTDICNRVNSLKSDATLWIESFNNLIQSKAKSIEPHSTFTDTLVITFNSSQDATKFRTLINRAGVSIPFYPAQLHVVGEGEDPLKVEVKRNIAVSLDQKFRQQAFSFVNKTDASANPTTEYLSLLLDRLRQIGTCIAGESTLSQQAIATAQLNPVDAKSEEPFVVLAQQIVDFKKAFQEKNTILKRYFENMLQTNSALKTNLLGSLESAFTQLKSKAQKERLSLEENEGLLKDELDAKVQQLSKKEELYSKALIALKNKSKEISGSTTALTNEAIDAIFAKNGFLIVDKNNPIIHSVLIDHKNDRFEIVLHKDVEELWKSSEGAKKELIQSLIFKEIAHIKQQTQEDFKAQGSNFVADFFKLNSTKSFLVMDLAPVYEAAQNKLHGLLDQFEPTCSDFTRENYPVIDFDTYQQQKNSDGIFSFVTYTPCLQNKTLPGFNSTSSYLILKDFSKIQKKYSSHDGATKNSFHEDFKQLHSLLSGQGYHAYLGSMVGSTNEFVDDLIFELPDVAMPLLAATREDFITKGSGRYAYLELSDVRQRILVSNAIDSKEQEDLLKSKELYIASQIDPSKRTYFDAPKPIRSTFWNNMLISLKKYLRGDERKVLKWGLDLSGGKTVEIQLKGANGKIVTDEIELKQGVNELFQRVNKMGVSEVSIRVEGSNIVLDFPGSQDISAKDLIQSSSMTFHIVNEKFSLQNPQLRALTNKFLQDIWNEAQVKGKTDVDSIQKIALEHLYGKEFDGVHPQHKSEAAKALYEAGLRFALQDDESSYDYNTSTSKIALMKGDDLGEWHGQTHPLMIVFNNFALEGSSLENVRASYDPKNGNFLSFAVKSKKVSSVGLETFPQENLARWTKVFCQDSQEEKDATIDIGLSGWRMAVILNGQVVSAPSLNAEIKDQAMITGNFTSRETQRLEADLKAGALSYTPVILSENNVSPELGSQQRDLGILAAAVALVCVVGIMCAYYRFFGIVASLAVVFNLLIIWAALQNIGATITLSGLAAIVLTIGMAVDANVLVLERVREEFAITKNLGISLHQGYKRAFTAIIDSNLTTILAALILMNFDAGPVKGFAVTLIIGVVSSMFTAFFVTRAFLFRWVKGKEGNKLDIGSWITNSNFAFLKYSKPVFLLSVIVCVAGFYSFSKNQKTLFGMDFTGGYSMSVELENARNFDAKEAVEKALIDAKIPLKSFQVKQIADSSKVRIILSKTLDEKNQPFYGMGLSEEKEQFNYFYELNPRVSFVVEALKKADLEPSASSLQNIHYSFKSVSGQMSDSMQRNALYGIALALLGILVYITVRFEFKYAISATIGLLYDLILTIAVLCILHGLGVGIQIDLNAIAALLTIAGYSLNDTIIVFDRVREDHVLHEKMPFDRLIDRSLNTTLSRTILTSSTTFIVLVCMVLIGGEAIFGFSLLMSLGVVIGTFSSFYVSSKLLHMFDAKEKTSVTALKELDI